MTCITFALLEKVDERLGKRMEDSKVLQDHLIGRAGADFLLATTERRTAFDGVKTIQLDVHERQSEDLITLISESEVDFSAPAYRVYADPANTPSLVDDNRVGDGFIIKAGRPYDSPEDNLRLLRALKGGARIESVYRRGGEPSAVIDSRILMARCGPYHPSVDEMLKPFQSKARKAVKLHVLPFNVKNGKITVDNTFKPTVLKFPQALQS
jgi:fructose 1,6-bisphosphatase